VRGSSSSRSCTSSTCSKTVARTCSSCGVKAPCGSGASSGEGVFVPSGDPSELSGDRAKTNGDVAETLVDGPAPGVINGAQNGASSDGKGSVVGICTVGACCCRFLACCCR
jgi:hypothetical protein